jgi:hypothetical protein
MEAGYGTNFLALVGLAGILYRSIAVGTVGEPAGIYSLGTNRPQAREERASQVSRNRVISSGVIAVIDLAPHNEYNWHIGRLHNLVNPVTIRLLKVL